MSKGHAEPTSGWDLANPTHRQIIVDEVRRLMDDAYPNGWNDRCPDVAIHAIYVLKRYGKTGYQIVAGQVKEVVGNPPRILFKGEYTGTGQSAYHTWVIGPAGEKIDLSVLPSRYGKKYMWEPFETLPELDYVEIPDTTCAVLKGVDKKYAQPMTQPVEDK